MQATTSSYDVKNSTGCVWCQQDIFYSVFSFSGRELFAAELRFCQATFLHLSLNYTIYDLTQYVVIDRSGNDKCVSQK